MDPNEAEEWLNLYNDVFEERCESIGQSINPDVAMVMGFSCLPGESEAWDRREDAFLFVAYALGYYFIPAQPDRDIRTCGRNSTRGGKESNGFSW